MRRLKIKKLTVILALLFLLNSCTNSGDATRALTAIGFKEIKNIGYKWFSCSEKDFYHTGFEALNPNGDKVYGVVCSGIFFENSTVRFQ